MTDYEDNPYNKLDKLLTECRIETYRINNLEKKKLIRILIDNWRKLISDLYEEQ